MSIPSLVALTALAICSQVAADDVTLASVSSAGQQANANTFGELSAEGRCVLLRSQATNLVVPDGNGLFSDAFVRDTGLGETTLANLNSNGEQANGQTPDARISADGRFVVFETHASNMPQANGNIQRVYIRDRLVAQTELISLSSSQVPADQISYGGFVTLDGRFVTFYSHATNLVSEPYEPPQSFLRDRFTDETFIATINSRGEPAQPFGALGPRVGNVSEDGRYVVFTNLWDDLAPGAPVEFAKVYLHDRQIGQTTLVSVPFRGAYADGACESPIISGDGRFVMFSSEATNLVPNDTNGVEDVFVRDLLNEQTFRVSISSNGEQSNAPCSPRAMSPNGRFFAFNSSANNLDPRDTNAFSDGFVHDRWTATTEKVTFNWQGQGINANAGINGVSLDGRVVLIGSIGTNVIEQPVNGFLAQYIRERWKLGDINRDGVVNVIDLLAIINAWGPCPAAPEPPALPIPCDADVTNDNTVNIADLLLILNNWG